MTGTWWDPARGGEGQFNAVECVGERRVASVFNFSYDSEGRSTWLVGNTDYEADASRVELPASMRRWPNSASYSSSAWHLVAKENTNYCPDGASRIRASIRRVAG